MSAILIRRLVPVLSLILILTLAACGSPPTPIVVVVTSAPAAAGSAAAAVAAAPLPAPTDVPISMPTSTPALPTYPDVLSTYPAGTTPCCTDAQVSEVTADGTYTLTGGKICPGRSEFTVEEGGKLVTGEEFFGGTWKCYGARLTVLQPVTIDGLTYPAGALLTVDQELQWIQVSSWTSVPGQLPAPVVPATLAPPPPAGEVVLLDSFDDNANDWPTGIETNEYATHSWQIVGGAYRWEARAHKEMFWYVYPESPSLGDVLASVRVLPVSGQGWHSYGLVFRLADDSFYLFSLNSQQEYSLRTVLRGEWGQVAGWRTSPAIHSGEANKLTLQAQGSRLSLWINDQLVAEVSDDQIASGHVGLMITMDPGSQGVFEFDDFELRRP